MATGSVTRNYEPINISQQYTCQQSDTWEYTGVAVQIPANSFYGLQGHCEYSINQPAGTGFGRMDDQFTDFYRYSASDGNTVTGFTYMTGYAESAMTVYLWGKWHGTGQNTVQINGWVYTQ